MTLQPLLQRYLPARYTRSQIEDLPWIPSNTPGKSSKPLRFFRHNRGFVELLRMEPGVVMPLHRHNGEIHAFNLSGQRQLCTGEVIGPGDYVYEPSRQYRLVEDRRQRANDLPGLAFGVQLQLAGQSTSSSVVSLPSLADQRPGAVARNG